MGADRTMTPASVDRLRQVAGDSPPPHPGDDGLPTTITALSHGWELALSAAGAFERPGDSDAAEWLPAIVPGTAAAALCAAGRWTLDRPEALHDKDIWYRTRLSGHGHHVLRFHGLA